MNDDEFELFVLKFGKDILRFCRMTAKDAENGDELSPEQIVLQQSEADMVQGFVASLPEKYRIPIYLYYSADMQINEISKILRLPEGTVKSRMWKAKKLLKEKLEAIGYDR